MVCHIQLKTESLWNKHLRSDQHAMRLQRVRDNALGRPPGAPPPPETDEDNEPVKEGERINSQEMDDATNNNRDGTNGSKKRKADSEDEPDDSRNKKSRVSDISSEADQRGKPAGPVAIDSDPSLLDGSTNAAEPAVDEDEYAAFERDIATPPPERSALTASAIIVAAPLSAAELAAQAREEAQSNGKERREAELEAEKEDAARRMEEELDEMAELEERVKRLREKREAIRKGTAEVKVVEVRAEEMVDKGSEVNDEQGEEDDEEDDELDEWGTWAR